MEQKKKRVRPSLTQMRALQAELARVKEDYRLQLVADKHLAEELEAVKLKLKKTTEQLYEVGMKNGSVIKVSDGYNHEEVEVLRIELDEYEKKLESQIDGTSNLVKDCNGWREKYRSLKAKYEEQIDGTSRLVADCDGWRERFRKLKAEYDDLNKRHQKLKIEDDNKAYDLERCVTVNDYEDLKEECKAIATERDTLEVSNKHMENELTRLRNIANSQKEELDRAVSKIVSMKKRGLWARIRNREV